MNDVKLPEPFGWKMSNPEFDYGITVHERYQVEDYLKQGWRIEEITFNADQMRQFREEGVREALIHASNMARMHVLGTLDGHSIADAIDDYAQSQENEKN